jgi:phosphoribosylanthranilate isomerase
VVEIKFCGLTRRADVAQAASLGARYAGFVFAPGPRRLTIESAGPVASALTRAVRGAAATDEVEDRGASPRRVGVFASDDAAEIAETVGALGLDVVQLHGGGGVALATEIRRRVQVTIWVVARVGDGGLSEGDLAQALAADGLLLDAKVDGALGGTGHAFDWDRVGDALATIRGRVPIILAGGLRPENVARAIHTLSPDVVDVSSGVESSPGIKDHARMRAFVDAVQGATAR